MKRNKSLVVFVLLWSLSLLNTFAYAQYSNFEPMTTAEGLNNNTIHNIIRGEKGYIWLSTDMGISRYDGFHFRNFPYSQKSDSTLTSAHILPQAVKQIYPANEGLLYLLLQNGGITGFNIYKERYQPVHFNPPFDKKKINDLYIADQHLLYIATATGLYSAEVKTTKEENQATIQVAVNKTPLVKGNISQLCSDDKGNLFFCVNKKQVIHYSMGTQQVKSITTGSNLNAEVSAIYVNGDYLWICRKWESIACYDYKREKLRTLTELNENQTNLHDTFVTEIVSVDKQTFYLSTWAGLYCIKFENESLYHSPYSIEHITPKGRINRVAVEGKMTSLFWDHSQNILWMGTFGGGAIKLGFNEEVYNRIMQQLGTEVNGIEEDAKGYIWLATERKGVWKSTSNSLTATTTFEPWTEVNTTESYHIYKDRNGDIWLGDEHNGIIQVDPLNGASTRHQLAPRGINGFAGNAKQFCLDSRARLWIVTTQGVVMFDAINGECTLIIKPEGEIKEVTALAEDKEGDLWVGTNMGVKRMDMQAGKAVLVGAYEQQVGLPVSSVSNIYVNSYNQIIVSYTDKIIRIDGREKDKVETFFTLNNGLNSGHIFCMIDDNNGNTWVGSNSGIMTIRNDRTSFYNYSLSGYCNNVCYLRDGRLLWSDSWGLIFFDPMIVKNRQSQKQLLLSDLWVNGKSVAVGDEINNQIILTNTPERQETFVFEAANNDFCFYFSDMQYGMMQRKIAYRLLPQDEEWKMCSLEDGIRYANLKSGNYNLQVKLIYPDASEGNVLEVSIVIKTYWWKTIWAFIGYLLVAGCIGIAVYYYILQKKKRKIRHFSREASLHEKIDLAKRENVLSEEKNEIQTIIATRFITELRTPLSLIVSPLREVLQEKELSKGLSTRILVAYRNSMGMLNACEQLLSIYSYIPNEKLRIAPYSIVKLTDALVFNMNEFLRVHPIEFQYEKKVKKDMEVWVDKKALDFVLQNVLYNAFIHIRYSGAIALILQEVVENDISYCSISIVDNGKVEVKTIEELKNGTEDLAQIDYAKVELGYDAIKEIIKLHHGTISLNNVKEGGTKIQIKFPINKAVFEQDENVLFITPEEQKEVALPQQGAIKTSIPDENLLLMEEEDTISTVTDKTTKTILVIEDNKDIRIYLKTIFEPDYNILLAINGLEGVALAKKEMPDLIISDVMMPLKDGYECCKELKENMDTCHIPFILLTAKVEDDDIIKGLEIGADDYILKPFTAKILKVKVRNLIDGRTNLKKMYTKLLVTPLDETKTDAEDDDNREIEDPFISTVVKIIEENMQEADFNVKKLAADLNMSQPTLYRKVKQCTDFTIIELIRGVRMRKAATLLKKKQYPVQEVVEMVGYNDIPTFRKHFVDTYGTTPSTFADSGIAEK